MVNYKKWHYERLPVSRLLAYDQEEEEEEGGIIWPSVNTPKSGGVVAGWFLFFLRLLLMMEKVPCTSSCCEWRGSLFRARCVFVMCISFIWPPTPVPSRSSQHHNKKKRLARRIIITDLSLIAFHPVLHPLSSRLPPPPI